MWEIEKVQVPNPSIYDPETDYEFISKYQGYNKRKEQ
jgi:hypothetical protein